MSRENFYFLLELPVDPPEETPDVIEKAIKKKQADWSRNRNHPTKGIQAQTNIGLMPSIREVMFDPVLRRKEAAEAQEILQQRDAQKFDVVDHHVAILGSKGYITQDEIDKLAWADNVDADELRKRIKFPDKPSKKRKLRKPRALGTDEKKTSARTLDPTVEGSINDNLKQLGKASLYDFLDLPADAKFSQLQRRARQKKSELSEVSKKDANATAGDTLAGHCISIFKNARSRKAYDASRASAHQAELNSDIDIAGLDGFIRYEYVEHLVKTGVQFGMDEVLATGYIEEYCLNNDLAVEQAPRQISKRMRIAAGVIAGLVLIVVIVSYIIIVPQECVQSYNEAVQKADDYSARGKDAQAIQVYERFNKRNDCTEQNKGALIKIKALKKKIDNQIKIVEEEKLENEHFKQIQQIDARQYDKRLSAYLEHQKIFPKGKHIQEIRKRIADIRDPYHQFALRMINQYKHPDRENWNECIRLSELFVNTYKDDLRNDDLKRNIKEYGDNAIIKNSFEDAKDNIGAVDYHTAKKSYKLWLEKEFFKHYAEILTERELTKILIHDKVERKKRASSDIRQRLRKTGGRFKETRTGVVQDMRSGKMWALLDSAIDYDFQNYGECLNYAGAEKYVKQLAIGGYKDWRLPKLRELQNIYGKDPSFPLNQTQWYWTATSYHHYDENVTGLVVDIVFPNSKNVWEKNQPTDAKFCGAVRAVRP